MSSTIPLFAAFLGSLALFSASSEIGHAFGLKRGREANVATLEASVLGLLALMLSFTFAMAVTRFDERRDAVLKEANAIGTGALRARLLPAPQNAESLRLLKEFLAAHVEVVKAVDAPLLADAAAARSMAIQEHLWREAKAAMAKDNNMAPTGLYIQALNDVFDNQESRLTAYRHRVPPIVFVALYGIAAAGIGFAGYASGLEKKQWRLPVYVVNLLAASVILLIMDIDRPDSGSILVSEQPILDTAGALATFAVDPEPPPAAKAAEPAKSAAPLRR